MTLPHLTGAPLAGLPTQEAARSEPVLAPRPRADATQDEGASLSEMPVPSVVLNTFAPNRAPAIDTDARSTSPCADNTRITR